MGVKRIGTQAITKVNKWLLKDEVLSALIKWTFILGMLCLVITLYLWDQQRSQEREERFVTQMKARLSTEDFEAAKAIDFHLWSNYCGDQNKGYYGGWECK